MTLDSSLK